MNNSLFLISSLFLTSLLLSFILFKNCPSKKINNLLIKDKNNTVIQSENLLEKPIDEKMICKKLKRELPDKKIYHERFRYELDLFIEKDLSLLEINPLVITSGGNLHCLDAKINIDSNALFRQKEIQDMHDPSQEDPREYEASKNDLSYVSLDGNIGCMVNGAGLAMGTMDTIKHFGGNPSISFEFPCVFN